MTESTPHLSHPKYRPDIDGLRAIAVLAVVAYHAFPNWMQGGFIGVDVFFVISGYLISTILFENLDRGTFSFTEFYSRRIRRIFPAVILVLVACFAFGWFTLSADEYKQLGKYIAAGAGFVSNLVLWGDAAYFDNSAETKPLLHLWSLSIEEQFYIIWPVLLWFAWKRKFNLLTITLLIALISLALNINGIKQDAVKTFYSPQTRFWELLSGSLLAWFTLYQKNIYLSVKLKIDGWLAGIIHHENPEATESTLSNTLSILGFILLAYGFWRISKDLAFPGKWALIPVVGSVLIIAAKPQAWLNRHLLSQKIFVWFGLISFPLYLWHWPLLSFARIIEGETPSRNIRIFAILASLLLSWVTVKFVEKPFRFSNRITGLKVTILCIAIFTIGSLGFVISKADFSQSHAYKKLAFKRNGFEHAIGNSLAWYQGKDDWLFLGNNYDNTVAKTKLANTPAESEIDFTTQLFSKISKIAASNHTKIVLIIGPNKSSIYAEYLPKALIPSSKKYSSYFFDRLKTIPNLTVYDPTEDFLSLKNTEGYLYWMTDTHWNNKGAFLAYSGVSKALGLPIPQVEFQHGGKHSGDLIGISKLGNFPLHPEDNWDVVWKTNPTWIQKQIPDEQGTAFGAAEIVSNSKPLSSKYVWVIGDSFTGALKQYFNATFKEVRYVGHWNDKLKELSSALEKADRKPDIVFIVRVERSF